MRRKNTDIRALFLGIGLAVILTMAMAAIAMVLTSPDLTSGKFQPLNFEPVMRQVSQQAGGARWLLAPVTFDAQHPSRALPEKAAT
jgi:hypothetical protein